MVAEILLKQRNKKSGLKFVYEIWRLNLDWTLDEIWQVDKILSGSGHDNLWNVTGEIVTESLRFSFSLILHHLFNIWPKFIF